MSSERPPDSAGRNIAVLGWVSFLNDVAAEATLRLVPLFLAQVLGAGTVAIGLIEGVADSTATLTKLASGWASDHLARRKPLVVAGYALSGLSKPFLLVAHGWLAVLFIRFSDRLGKGIRNAPRDALAADSAPPERRGHSFGLMSALDTLGALAGLGLALAVVARGGPVLTRASFDTVVLIAIVPAALAVALVAFGVHEPARSRAGAAESPDEHARVAGPVLRKAALPAPFWRYMAVLALFALSNSSDAFLVLKASHSGGLFGLEGTPFVLVCLLALCASQALLALPIGRLSDRIGRKSLIVAGWLIYAAAYAGFAATDRPAWVLALFLFYGAFYGFTDGVERSLVADLVGARRGRGFAYGIFNFVMGLMALPASLLFGIVAQKFGETTGFAADAALASLAAIGLAAVVPSHTSATPRLKN